LKEDEVEETFNGNDLAVVFVSVVVISVICLFCLTSMNRGEIRDGFERIEFSINVLRHDLANRIDVNNNKSNMLMYVEEQQFLKSLR